MKLLLFLISMIFVLNLFAQDRSSEITCEPFYENNKIVGFTCSELHEDSLLSKMGLTANDVIVEYDGKPIHSYKDMQKFYEQLHVKGKMNIKYKRDQQVLQATNTNK